MTFTHLHTHSHYSLLDGLAKVPDLVNRAKELGMDALALTDHGVMYGAIEFYKAAKAAGIKPIIGEEFYLAAGSYTSKNRETDYKRYHIVLLAKDNEGYRNLIRLTTEAHLNGFYYKPRIDKELLRKHHQGLIALSACLAGEIPQAILAGASKKELDRLVAIYSDIFGKEDFYIELQHHPNIPQQEKVNQQLIALAYQHGLKLVATNDIHYLLAEDGPAQDILVAVQTNKSLRDENRLSMVNENFSMKSPEEMEEAFSSVPEAITNTAEVAEKCTVELELGKIQLPFYKIPESHTYESYVRELCHIGLQKRFGFATNDTKLFPRDTQGVIIVGANRDEHTRTILERFNYEMSIIEKTGFASYFLIVQDFVNWAKDNGIVVGPGRGSAAGSLVAYLLGITNIDPLKYDLLFERFLNPERISMPDIDMDFADARRDEVLAYVAQRYGRNHVAQIITFGTMASKAAIRDVGRSLGYEYSYCDNIAKMVPFGWNLKQTLDGDQEFQRLYNTDDKARRLIDFALKLEGVSRHASTHACGVVITKDPLEQIVALQYASRSKSAVTGAANADDAGNESGGESAAAAQYVSHEAYNVIKNSPQNVVTQYEMHAIEDLGLLKMDFLGLRNLTIIENTLKLIKKIHNVDIDIDALPLDDDQTFALFRRGDTTGVFQFESAGMKRYLKELKSTNIEDVIAMVALYRPGPIQFIPDYIDRKHGRTPVTYLDSRLEPIMENTYGVMVYQEQLMRLSMDLAGFSRGEADVLRKAVGKKIKALLDEQKTKLIEGMIKNGVQKNTAQQIWDSIEPFASYGFNRSHSVCYAVIAYQTAYLKSHYPAEFMAVLLGYDALDIERTAFLIDECKAMDIPVFSPDINESKENFTVISAQGKQGKDSIRFGLSAIKNVSANMVRAIIEERRVGGRFHSMEDFVFRMDPAALNKKSLEALIKSGAFDSLGERNALLENLEHMLHAVRKLNTMVSGGQMGLFDIAPSDDAASAHNGFLFKIEMKKATPASPQEKLFWEKDLLGLYTSGHPMADVYVSKGTRKIGDCYQATVNPANPPVVQVAGIVNKIKRNLTKKGELMLFVEVEDTTGKIELVVFPRVLAQSMDLWRERNIISVSGRLDNRGNSLKIVCNNAQLIEV